MKKLLFIIFAQIFSNCYSQGEFTRDDHYSIEFRSLFNTKIRDSVSCYRIPAIATAPNGDLIAAIDERVTSCGDLRMNKDINYRL